MARSLKYYCDNQFKRIELCLTDFHVFTNISDVALFFCSLKKSFFSSKYCFLSSLFSVSVDFPFYLAEYLVLNI